ncbi:PAS domain-containing protein [Leucothrix sargassi]|nr:PAS domain-containing protein [Leucothrix sargassi]
MNREPIDIADAMATGVVLLTGSLDILYMNASAEILFGSSRRRMKGQSYTRLIREDIIGWVLTKAVDTGEVQSLRERHLTTSQDGDVIIADIVVSPQMKDDELQGVLIEFYRIDQQLRITQEEALVSQLQATQSLVRGMAHEIKNPLGGLRGAAQLLESELPSADLREYTSIIISEADRLQVLVDRMSGSQSPNVQEKINIHEVLERVRKLVSVDIPSNVSIRFDYDPSIPDVMADKDKLIQIVLNIVVNALKAVGDKGSVVFKTRVVRRFMLNQKIHRLVLKLQIIDTGVGIPDEIKDKVFFPMVSGSADGTGLGLSIAQSLANAHDGLIEFQSVPGKTCFTLLLPIQVQE